MISVFGYLLRELFLTKNHCSLIWTSCKIGVILDSYEPRLNSSNSLSIDPAKYKV